MVVSPVGSVIYISRSPSRSETYAIAPTKLGLMRSVSATAGVGISPSEAGHLVGADAACDRAVAVSITAVSAIDSRFILASPQALFTTEHNRMAA